MLLDSLDRLPGQRLGTILEMGPLGFNTATKLFGTQRLDQNLDPRLEFVVTSAELVIHPQQGFQVGQQMLPGQVVANDLGNHRGAAKAAAGKYLDAHFALAIT